jgi:hypothetical protein
MSFFLRLSLCVVAALGAAQIVAGAVHNEVVVVAGAAPDGASLRPLPSPLVHAPVSSHAAMSFAFDPNDPEVQQYIRDRFGSSSHVAYVRRSIPRWGGPDEISADRDYLEEVIKTVAPGAALFVITILIWIVWGW